MKSHRDNVKDAVAKIIGKYKKTGDVTVACEEEIKGELIEAVFDALDITAREQDMLGGSFILKAGREAS